MASKNQAHERFPVCGAKKSKGGICRAAAGRGTSHPGTGRCKHHGGKSTGPKNQAGNKNALKTGRYEGIFADVLEPDEREVFAQVDTNTLVLVDEELKLVTIRERRMLKRIADLKAAGDMTLTEETVETMGNEGQGAIALPDDFDRLAGDLDESSLDRLKKKLEAAKEAGNGPKVKRKHEGTLGQIQAIERDLTAVQSQKARLIEIKHKLETAGKDGTKDGDFDGSLFGGDDDDEDDGAGA